MAAWKMRVGKMAATDLHNLMQISSAHGYFLTRLKDSLIKQTVQMWLLEFVKIPNLSVSN